MSAPASRGVANAVALVSGAVFAAGLVLSGMTQPAKITAFLDVTGAWDPSLAFVMVGAIAVAAVAFRVAAKRRRPIVPGTAFDVPPANGRIDGRLVAGAAIFGLGWGISGYCPGPAVVSLASGKLGPLVFVAFMVAGMAAYGLVARRRKPVHPAPTEVATGTPT